MVDTFLQKRRIQKYLTLLLLVVVLITIIVLWNGFFRKKPFDIDEEMLMKKREINIDFQLLKSPFLENLQPYEEIILSEEKIGRENPFLLY